MIKQVTKAVFPVAGLGTRFLPATKVMPKEMLTIVDKPLIQYAVEEAAEAGIEKFIFVTGRGKALLADHFDHSFELETVLEEQNRLDALQTVRDCLLAPGQLIFTRQPKPLGLGHAVWCARDVIGNEPFAVLLADDLIHAKPGCLKQMMEVYKQTGGNIVAVENVPRELTNRYGILDIECEKGDLISAKGVVEKPAPKDAPSTLSIIGRYILQPQVFACLDKKEKGAGGEIQLTDAIAKTIGDIPLHGLKFKGKRFDCGNKVGFVEANIAYALDHKELNSQVRQMLKDYV